LRTVRLAFVHSQQVQQLADDGHGHLEKGGEVGQVLVELVGEGQDLVAVGFQEGADWTEAMRTERFTGLQFGKDEIKIPVEQYDMMQAHVGNFLECMRTREKPHLDVETAAHAQVLITLAVESYREGRVKYWDEKNWKASDRPLKT